MKKLFTICLFLGAVSIYGQDNFIKVQPTPAGPPRSFVSESSQTDMSTVVNDTLNYFYNKHFFRNTYNGTPTSPNGLFYGLALPYYQNTFTITHVGSVFFNTTPIQVNGLEGAVLRHAASVSQSVAVKLYLCALNGAQLPILPALDSIATVCPPTPNGFVFVGGTFTAPVTVNGNFAVLFKNDSPNNLDTVRFIMNNAATLSSTVVSQMKYGEGMGRMRYRTGTNAIAFYSNTNTFGTGTDYEFIVAPRVAFSYSAGISVITPTVCTNGSGYFGNVSGPSVLENRQFNFNQFYKHWSPWSLTTNSLISVVLPDSIYTWNFTGSPSGTSYFKNPNVVFNTPGTQTASLTARYRYQANLGNSISLTDGTSANINVSNSAAPVISISGATAICAGSTITLTATGNTTFTWTSPPNQGPIVVVNPQSTTVYTVSAESGGCVAIATLQVIVSTQPNVNIAAPAQACKGVPFTMSATGAQSYSWSTSATTNTVSVVSNTAGVSSYTVYGTNLGCPPGQGVANVVINDPPQVSLNPPTFSVCTKVQGGLPIDLGGSPPGGVYSPASVGSGSFTPNNQGTFVANYTYTDASTGCFKTASVAIVVSPCTDIESQGLNGNLIVYPNPAANGMINLRNLEGVNTIQVFNILGVQVSRQQSDKPEHAIDLSALPQGHYLIKVTDSSGGSRTVKILNLH